MAMRPARDLAVSAGSPVTLSIAAYQLIEHRSTPRRLPHICERHPATSPRTSWTPSPAFQSQVLFLHLRHLANLFYLKAMASERSTWSPMVAAWRHYASNTK